MAKQKKFTINDILKKGRSSDISILNPAFLERLEEIANTPKIKADISQLDTLNKQISNFDVFMSELEKVMLKLSEDQIQVDSKQKMIVKREKELVKRESKLKQKAIEVEREDKKVKKSKDQIQRDREASIDAMKDIEGNSRIDQILGLIKKIKLSIVPIPINPLSLNVDEEDLTFQQKRFSKGYYEYAFTVESANKCQDWINRINIGLTMLYKEADDITDFETRLYFRSRGILKGMHYSFDHFDNVMHTNTRKPFEIQRIFSAIESCVSSLAKLDDTIVLKADYQTVTNSFKNFEFEDKMKFFNTYFTSKHTEFLTPNLQKDLYVILQTKMLLTPAQIIAQIDKYNDTRNEKYRAQLIDFLKTALTKKERYDLADDMIEDAIATKIRKGG